MEQQGHTVDVFDCNAEGFNTSEIQRLLASSDAVGMTIYSEPRELENSVVVAHFVKNCRPDITLILGGPHCSLSPEKALQQHNANICVQGPGEQVIVPLIEALEGKRDISTIPGVYWKEGDLER